MERLDVNYKEILGKMYEMSCPGVYRIKNVQNNRIYIGSTSISLRNRLIQHVRELHKGTHHSHKLQKDFNVCGINGFKFEIIIDASEETVVDFEQIHMDLEKPYYNIFPSARSSRGYKMSDQQKLSLSMAKMSSFDPIQMACFYMENGLKKTITKFHTSCNTINTIVDELEIPRRRTGITHKVLSSHKEYPHSRIVNMYDSGMSLRAIKKEAGLSFERIRKTIIDSGREVIKRPPLTAEQLRKLSEAHKGKVFSEEHRENLSKAFKGKRLGGNNGNSRKVINIKTGVIYSSVTEVADLYGYKWQSFWDRLDGRTKNDTDFVFFNALNK